MTKQDKNKIFIITSSILILSLIIFLTIIGSTAKETPKVVKVDDDFIKKEVVEERGIEYPVNEYDGDKVIDSTNMESYWYIHFHVSTKVSQYDGYNVIKLSTSYFDIIKAIKVIVPNYTESDYVGIDFFKRVPYETYLSMEGKN